MQTLANMMIRQILGEGSKNISNIDRKLAQELVGLMGDWERITADPRVLEQKILNIRGRIIADYNSNLENINGAISDVSDWNKDKAAELQEMAERTYGKLREVKQKSAVFLRDEPTALKVSTYFDTDFNLIKPFPS
jgi:predicted phage tail protein